MGVAKVRAAALAASVSLLVLACSAFGGSESPAGVGADAGGGGTDALTNTADLPIALTVGSAVACALRASGRVNCWGDNSKGAVGIGLQDDVDCSPHTARCRPTAVEVATVTDATQISAGGGFACAVRKNGDVVCWGENDPDGKLGDGTKLPPFRFEALPITGLPPALEVTAGATGACARVTENATTRVYCWGVNEVGLNGLPSSYDLSKPTVIPMLDGAKAVRLSTEYPGTACAIKADDTILCWGANSHGVLGHVIGDPSTGGDPECGTSRIRCNHTPSPVGESAFKADDVVVGRGFACALRAGKVYCWGANGLGGLGRSPVDGDAHPSPLEVPGLEGVTKLSARRGHVCAIVAGGQLSCWGANGAGELANGFQGGPGYPAERCKPEPGRATELSGFTDVSAGDGVTIAIAQGTVYGWGTNNTGRLGHPRNTSGDQVAGCEGSTSQVCNGIPQVIPLP